MRSTEVKNIVLSSPVSTAGLDIRIEWRYITQPLIWRIAAYRAHVLQSGELQAPIPIVYDEAESNTIEIKITPLDCSAGYSYFFTFIGTAITTTTTTTTSAPPPDVIEATVDALLYNAGFLHPVKLYITYSEPLPGPVSFNWGFDIRGNNPYNTAFAQSFGYPPVNTYFLIGSGNPASETYSGGFMSHPKGTTSATGDNKWDAGNATDHYVSKLVFFNIISPPGYLIKFNKTRVNLIVEQR